MFINTIINEKWLKEFSPIPLNYNMKELGNYVKLAEAIWLEPVLGSLFYNDLLEQVVNNEVTDVNASLLQSAIYPYLGFAVAYESLPLMWAHISEVGITKGKSDNSDSLELKDMTYVHTHLRNQVEVRKDYLKKWICERYEHFPNIDLCACGCVGCQDGLTAPNPLNQIYSPRKVDTDLK